MRPEGTLRSKNAAVMLVYSRSAAGLSIASGILVLAAWKLSIASVITAGSDHKGMARSTALGLVLSGIGLLLLQEGARSAWIRRLGSVCVLVPIVLGAGPFLRMVYALPSYLDENLLNGTLPAGSKLFNVQMSPNTGLCLILLGCSLLLLDRQAGRWRPSQACALLAGTIALAACIGYAYDVKALYDLPGYTSMAVHSAATLLILSIGIVFARPRVGLMAMLSGEGPVGSMARRYLPIVIAAPIVTGWFRLQGQRAGWYGTEAGTALYATVNVVFLLAFLYLAITSRTAAEEKFRGLLESAPDAMVIVNPAGRVVLVNARTEELFGYSREELLGNPVEMLLPERSREKHMGDRTRFVSAPKTRSMGSALTLQGRKKNGQEFPVEIMLAPVHSDGSILICSTIRDITERERIARALRESEERFRVALKGAPTVVFNQDRELRYTWINSPVLSWAEQGYLGRTDEEILGGDEGARLSAIKRKVLETGVGSRTETIVTYQGEPHYFDLTVEPLRDTRGEIVGVTCASSDVTPMKKGAAERDRLILELQDALAQVKVLRGLLPICASCKKIRDDHGEWASLEDYIGERADVNFTHGICPDCAQRLYPEVFSK